MTNPASALSPPTLHWGLTGPRPETCDLCGDTIKPHADCFLSIRRAFELQQGRMVETAPLTVLMCVECGWTRPYSPVPREGAPAVPETPKGPQEPASKPDGALWAGPLPRDTTQGEP